MADDGHLSAADLSPVDQGPTRRLVQLLDGLDEAALDRLYGRSARLDPEDAAALLDGLGEPWWIVGGWAIEAATGVGREHGDVDVCILACHVPQLIEHFQPTHQLWATGSGMLCPILAPDQPLPDWSGQIWIRAEAADPWLLDVVITPDDGGRWVFKRDRSVVADLEAVTWTADDGLRYQNPEIVLAFKARHQRPKDDADLLATLPTLEPRARSWLAETIARLHPAHPWLDALTTG